MHSAPPSEHDKPWRQALNLEDQLAQAERHIATLQEALRRRPTYRSVGYGTFIDNRLVSALPTRIKISFGRPGIEQHPLYVQDIPESSAPPAQFSAIDEAPLDLSRPFETLLAGVPEGLVDKPWVRDAIAAMHQARRQHTAMQEACQMLQELDDQACLSADLAPQWVAERCGDIRAKLNAGPIAHGPLPEVTHF